jgi:hypothetical protein
MGNQWPQVMEWINMDVNLQKYYEQRLDMMSSDAWQELMVDVEQMLKSADTLSGIEDEKSLHFRRGEISMMRWMLSIAKVSEDAYEELKNEDNS